MIRFKKIFLVLTMLIFSALVSFSQNQFNAVVVDLETKDALPFSIVYLNNTKVKTDGNGVLLVSNPIFPLSICVDYLGYKDTCLIVQKLPLSIFSIELEQGFVQLSEVNVRPFTPVEYIQESRKLFRQNYANDKFQVIASYEDWFAEDNRALLSREATLKSTFNYYLDSLKPESHQILSFVGSDSIGEIDFMKAKLKKIAEKERKKAEEKGEEFVELEDLTTMASGPDLIYYLGIDYRKADCLDSSKFKKFVYSFDSEHEELNEIAIVFKSKHKVNHVKQRGKLVFDSKSLALKEFVFVGNFVVPAVYKSVLWIAGFSIKSTVIEVKVNFKEENSKWYPLFCFWHAQGQIKKRHWFKKNEESLFDVRQKVVINELFLGDRIIDTPEKKQYNYKRKMAEQVFLD